jgi:colanic acid/amylovoran biosynthesis protein
MKIFVIGQCTLHWGRMEYGNIGNYYIIEPFFRELHKVFPSAVITTTFQMSDDFCRREKIETVPMQCYYGWNDNDLDVAYKELSIATIYSDTKTLIDKTRYIEEVLSSDLVIDFSGDIWGQNANLVGPNRFLVGLIKDRIAQLLGKPTAMIAGSPGPFDRDVTLPFARLVYKSFDLVANREPVSRQVLCDFGFDVSKTKDYVCPAFVFEPADCSVIHDFIVGTPLEKKEKPVVGFILCGWNMKQGPYNREDWADEEFSVYSNLIQHFVKDKNVDVCLMSHSNGFELPPNFKLIYGRDFPIVKKLYDLLQKTEVRNSIFLLDGLYSPKITKILISMFDMLISGRVHGAVAGLSQNVPTVIIDYGHEPKAHKLLGFAKVAGIEQYVANPNDFDDLVSKVYDCWDKRFELNRYLESRNLTIRQQLKEEFLELKNLV